MFEDISFETIRMKNTEKKLKKNEQSIGELRTTSSSLIYI